MGLPLLLPHVSLIAIPRTGKLRSFRSIDYGLNWCDTRAQFRTNYCVALYASSSTSMSKKLVWIWTENKRVMTAAVERGWNTFVFSSHCRGLANEWSCKISQLISLFFFPLS
ncbi:hypothetical protein U1Q18_012342 [Sarracenia purpurea var. burkii]